MFIQNFFSSFDISRFIPKSELEIKYGHLFEDAKIFKQEWNTLKDLAPDAEWPKDMLSRLNESGKKMRSETFEIRNHKKAGFQHILTVSAIEQELNELLPILEAYIDANEHQRTVLSKEMKHVPDICNRIIDFSSKIPVLC